MKKSILALVLVLVALFAVSAAGKTQGGTEEVKFPVKPIKIVVPNAPGGSTDIMSRAIAELSPKYFGQPMVIVNREGAAQTLATAEFVSADPDGYNLLICPVGTLTTQPFLREVQFKLDDFEGIIGTSVEPILLAVHKDTPYNSIEDLVADGKNTGKNFKYAMSGSGALPHLAQSAFFSMADLKAEPVPFNGGGPAVTAALGQHVDMVAAHPTELLPFVQDGQLKLLGIFSSERDPREELKNVPTFKEKGYDINMTVWKFFLVPKGTPREIRDKLYEGLSKILKDESFVKFADTSYLFIDPVKSDDIIPRVRDEQVFNQRVMKELGLIK